MGAHGTGTHGAQVPVWMQRRSKEDAAIKMNTEEIYPRELLKHLCAFTAVLQLHGSRDNFSHCLPLQSYYCTGHVTTRYLCTKTRRARGRQECERVEGCDVWLWCAHRSGCDSDGNFNGRFPFKACELMHTKPVRLHICMRSYPAFHVPSSPQCNPQAPSSPHSNPQAPSSRHSNPQVPSSPQSNPQVPSSPHRAPLYPLVTSDQSSGSFGLPLVAVMIN